MRGKNVYASLGCKSNKSETSYLSNLTSRRCFIAFVDECADNGIPLPNVTSKILSKVTEYCKKHVEEATKGGGNGNGNGGDEELKKWDSEFVKVDQAALFDLILAANYLDIKSLLDLTCQTVVDMIKQGRTPDEILKIFNIKNDFTPEEEKEIQRENQWAFE